MPATYLAMTVDFSTADAPVGALYDAVLTKSGAALSSLFNVTAPFNVGISGRATSGGGSATLRTLGVTVTMTTSTGSVLNSRTKTVNFYEPP